METERKRKDRRTYVWKTEGKQTTVDDENQTQGRTIREKEAEKDRRRRSRHRADDRQPRAKQRRENNKGREGERTETTHLETASPSRCAVAAGRTSPFLTIFSQTLGVWCVSANLNGFTAASVLFVCFFPTPECMRVFVCWLLLSMVVHPACQLAVS